MTAEEYLAHFRAVYDTPELKYTQHTREIWNKRAPDWEAGLKEDPVMRAVTQVRITGATRFLSRAGALEPGFRVIDIGCGPGRFVAEFAKHVRTAEGTDFSDGMLENARAYCAQQGMGDNTSFTQADFLTCDIDALGWRGAYDLVFASMTPALRRYTSLEKMIWMSRAFVCTSNCILQESSVEKTIADTLGPDRLSPMWDGRNFYTTFNVVWNLGYYPRLDYFDTSYDTEWEVTPEKVQMTVERMLHGAPPEPDDVPRAYDALRKLATDGKLTAHCSCIYGTMLWDVRRRSPRW